VSFEVASGETLVLLGTSGCGKTTTLKMINRLIEPSSGEILLGEDNILLEPQDSLRRRIGYVIQNIGLFPHYTVAQNISVVPRLLSWREKEIKPRVHALLEMVQLDPGEFAHKLPHQLSGGQKQRVGFARALAARPPVILMDEPFGALDPITRATIQEEFVNLSELKDKTKILVTHDMNEAIELGDRICLMDNGVIQSIGTPKELLFEPRNDFVKDFFRSQRLHLELMVLSLGDLLPFLPKLPSSQNSEIPSFELNSKLLRVLERMEQREDGQQNLEVLHGSDSLLTSCEGLMSAFYRFKLPAAEVPSLEEGRYEVLSETGESKDSPEEVQPTSPVQPETVEEAIVEEGNE